MRTEELKRLLSDMSLEEKIGQMIQLPGYFFEDGHLTGPALEMGLSSDALYLSGSLLSVVGADKIVSLQKTFIEHQPHHIPMLFMADIINGYRTVYPIPLAQGCSFDPDLAERCAVMAAKESAVSGLHVTFSPMADLVRDARWGRVMESTGEDAYLNGEMAAAMVRGYQGKNLADKGRIAACLKHFAGYGAPTAGRDYNTVELSPRTLLDDYMPAYARAVDADTAMVMTSFNTLDRIPSSANKWLLRKILREQMGFEGVIISDWGALFELLRHGIAADVEEAARLSIEAGVDIDMSSPVYPKALKKLVDAGIVPVALIDEAAWRILALKNKLGLFENPYKDASVRDEQEVLLCPAHRRLAQEAAEKSFVLLKNEEGTLPLDLDASLACIGPYWNTRQLKGAWSIFAEDRDCATLQEVFSGLPFPSVQFAEGCAIADPGSFIVNFNGAQEIQFSEPEKALSEAVALAKTADQVVLALGEHREFTGEGASHGHLTLPECQLRLLKAVAAVNPNITVVLFTGRPLDIRAVQQYAKAILVAWMPGTEGAKALARVLTGETAPSGKLSMSFPYCVGQVPIHYNQMRTGRPFQGDYRKERFFSKYLDIPNEPLYPFGFGLTYTSFGYSPVKLDKEALTCGDTLRASVQLTNTGSRAGTETVQLYIHDVAGSVTRPIRELKGFRKVTLAPGETREVAFEITADMLRFHDIDMRFTSEPGDFEVYIGPDSQTENKADFTLK